MKTTTALESLAKWSPFCVLTWVLFVVAWSYVSAREQASLPLHHPWPALSLVIGTASIAFIATKNKQRLVLVLKLVSAVLMLLAATVYMWSLL